MITRTTSPDIKIISTTHFNKIVTYTIISLVINNILFIASAIGTAHQYDSYSLIIYYVTLSFVIRSILHVLLVVIMLKLFPIQLHYDGRCPNCNSKLSMQKYVLQGTVENKCQVCKETVKIRKNKFICITRY